MFSHPLDRHRGRGPVLRSLSHLHCRPALGVLLTVAMLACGDSASPETIDGTYTLRTINGQPLPVVLQQDATSKNEVTAGAIAIGPGTAWTISLTVRSTLGVDVSLSTSTLVGTWTRSGERVTLTATGGESETAVLSGGTLTLAGEAAALGIVPWVFRK
jgi:hypothetical protein